MLLKPSVWVLFLNCGYKKEEREESKNESIADLFAGFNSGSIFTPLVHLLLLDSYNKD
jgi:SUMO ligase MMS21 Smc5/6 complex component|tara:strand:+ start:619 stop:792 length:174 start_codon:yes stop_codon:yes gene_type:complete